MTWTSGSSTRPGPTVGYVVASRRPESYAGWAMLAFGLAFGIVILLATYAGAGVPPASRRLPGAVLALWADNVAFVPVLAVFASLILMYFPNGRLLDPRWRSRREPPDRRLAVDRGGAEPADTG